MKEESGKLNIFLILDIIPEVGNACYIVKKSEMKILT